MNKLAPITLLIIGSYLYGQTQLEYNLEASKTYKKTDLELNQVYKRILNLYSNDTLFIKNLRTSQRNWIRFRDSEFKMRYPEYTNEMRYGSMQPSCENHFLAKITSKRIKTLKLWLQGTSDGDGCSGSIKHVTHLSTD